MVACANPAYKIEDLYALLERLKSHPQPAKVFCAMNNRREVNNKSQNLDSMSIFDFELP